MLNRIVTAEVSDATSGDSSTIASSINNSFRSISSFKTFRKDHALCMFCHTFLRG